MHYSHFRNPRTVGLLVLCVWQGCIAEAAEPKQPMRATIQRHFIWADNQCRKAINESLQPVEELFNRAKHNTPALAEEMLGFRSKWCLVVDYLPLTRGGRHQRFVQAKVAKHVFTSQQLTRAIERAIHEYVKSVEDIENQMLVRMRADIKDQPRGPVRTHLGQQALQEVLEDALSEVRRQVAKDLRRDVGTLVISEITGEITRRVVLRVLRNLPVRTGVSHGIFAAGAGSSWPTFGASIAVGLVLDWLVIETWDWWSDPNGELAATLDRELDRLHGLLINGDGTRRGLRGELEAVARRRAAGRREAVLKALSKSEE